MCGHPEAKHTGQGVCTIDIRDRNGRIKKHCPCTTYMPEGG